MGSGTSKENEVNSFVISDEEEETIEWKENKREKKVVGTKDESVLRRVFGKHKENPPTSNLVKSRTIINLASSDSEEEYKQQQAHKEAELTEDINSLEKTLNSLGLVRKVRQVSLLNF